MISIIDKYNLAIFNNRNEHAHVTKKEYVKLFIFYSKISMLIFKYFLNKYVLYIQSCNTPKFTQI